MRSGRGHSPSHSPSHSPPPLSHPPPPSHPLGATLGRSTSRGNNVDPRTIVAITIAMLSADAVTFPCPIIEAPCSVWVASRGIDPTNPL